MVNSKDSFSKKKNVVHFKNKFRHAAIWKFFENV